MQINMSISSDELINAAKQMPVAEKIRLFESIENDIFEFKFRQLVKELQTTAISQEEILAEVESVRAERYKNSH